MPRSRPARCDVPWWPTPEQIAAAAGRSVPDVIARGLRVLFVGINPSLYSAAVGHHFARPGNRFWRALHDSGFTPRQLSPFEDDSLTTVGLGVTNFVARATASADQLSRDELERGGRRLARSVARLRPRTVAFLGLGSYRSAFGRPHAVVGAQLEEFEGSAVWLLPNPSGLNAHHQAGDLARLFAELRRSVDARPLPARSVR